MKQTPDPYQIVRRIDWIREFLTTDIQFNTNDICRIFGISLRTAARDVAFVKGYFHGRVAWDQKGRRFFLKPEKQEAQ